MDSHRILGDFFRKTWPFYVLSVCCHLVANIIHVNFPRVLGNFTDELKDGLLSVDGIVQYSWTLLGIGVGFAVIGGIGQFLVMYTGRYFEFMNRRRLFVHFTGLSERFYSKNGVGKLLSYFMNDVTTVREAISMGINQTANSSILLVSTIVMLLITNVPLYLVAASIAPLLLIPVIVVWLGPIIRRRSLQVQEALGVMTESAEEQFGGIRVTKKFAVEDTMKRRFGTTVDRIRDKQLRLVRVSSLFQSIIPFLGATSLIIALLFGGYLTILGRITVGNFVALTLYIRMLMNPLQQIGNVINVVQRARASLDRLNDLLGKQADIKELPGAKELNQENPGIEVRDLSFSYEDADGQEEGARQVLRGIQLDVPPGSTLGIIGRTGSGKTTLMKLLLRTFDPPPGKVLIGGVDIRKLTLKSLREGIAYVPQDGFLFSSTIRENIAFYKRDTEPAVVEEAARKARVYDNIVEFPDKFETRLGERGITLSGGQRQRTSLARGIIKDAPILILDDSVSAVDAVTETEIMETIRDIRAGKTTIIIAHRISALKHADEIIVLDQGEMVQRGTHEELLSKDGLYRTLHDIQEEGMKHHGTGH
ncbi:MULTISPECIES: ABC transporter ATP-binding protein [unclassified Paenibacillus]|uniref:ABC transporter ATP-binding protein n=1 Tax=unclassified Paenibacillus TaxID=185978 RepID=UPI000DC3DA60|nr:MULTISPECIES: ABC transporter ATP-binding protein [unclassified Paenibacillus]MCT1399689.1 ABC transporter ATP-binding protein/permease [Paenibacillus sp. p3-SID867]RAR41410.1 ABC transporter ATP-binding protein [Paenibacillus sp. MDMC362]